MKSCRRRDKREKKNRKISGTLIDMQLLNTVSICFVQDQVGNKMRRVLAAKVVRFIWTGRVYVAGVVIKTLFYFRFSVLRLPRQFTKIYDAGSLSIQPKLSTIFPFRGRGFEFCTHGLLSWVYKRKCALFVESSNVRVYKMWNMSTLSALFSSNPRSIFTRGRRSENWIKSQDDRAFLFSFPLAHPRPFFSSSRPQRWWWSPSS